MKIRRYFAPDIKQAINLVREEQGPDAVILSNRKVEGGVEIVAAKDFDEQAMMDQLPTRIIPTVRETAAQVQELKPRTTARSDSQRRAEAVFREALIAAKQVTGMAIPAKSSRGEPGKPVAAAPTCVQEIPVLSQRTEAGNESSPAKALQDLQREMRLMRRSLDVHFSEVAWENAARSAPTRLELLRQLSAYGFSKKLSQQIANRLGGVEDFNLAWQGCHDLLASQLPVVEDNLLDYGGIVALVGPTGVGKTTTIAKLAARFRLKHGPRQMALITTDNHRIGAHDQLATYGRILDVPVRMASNAEELRSLLSNFYDKRLVLIDTAGMGTRDLRLAEQFAVLRLEDIPIKPYLVLSAASQAHAMSEAIRAFSGFLPKACVLTKLDETLQLGAALSTLIDKQLPVALVTDGQQVPEDLHLARTHLLLERCFYEFSDESEYDGLASQALTYEDWVSHANV